MEKTPQYLAHHVKVADVAVNSSRGMTPEENARDLRQGWIMGNKYPNTKKFIQALADLIRIREECDNIEIIPDDPKNTDPICLACRNCKKKFR